MGVIDEHELKYKLSILIIVITYISNEFKFKTPEGIPNYSYNNYFILIKKTSTFP